MQPIPIELWEKIGRAAKFKPEQTATLAGISLRQMERIFARDFAQTPTEWLRMLQCRLAKELIEKGYTTRAAAHSLHFFDEAQLCRKFKQVYGVSPQHFAPGWRWVKERVSPS